MILTGFDIVPTGIRAKQTVRPHINAMRWLRYLSHDVPTRQKRVKEQVKNQQTKLPLIDGLQICSSFHLRMWRHGKSSKFERPRRAPHLGHLFIIYLHRRYMNAAISDGMRFGFLSLSSLSELGDRNLITGNCLVSSLILLSGKIFFWKILPWLNVSVCFLRFTSSIVKETEKFNLICSVLCSQGYVHIEFGNFH